MAAAGVSTATVSAVVNGRAAQYGICRATQEKVQAAIRQMSYSPSLAALDMVAGRNSLVGLAITADCPGSDRLIAAMEPALAQAGFRLIVICLPAAPAAAVARITDLARYGIGALAIYPARVLPLPGIGCPVVMVCKAGVGLPADCSLSAVQQLGQATARWLQLASQGTPPSELLLEPVLGVTPTNPPPTALPPTPPPAAVPPVSVPNAPALSPVEVPAVSMPNPVTTLPITQPLPRSVPESKEVKPATDVIPATPVEEATVTIPTAETPVDDVAPAAQEPAVAFPESQPPESQPESTVEPSESIQMTETEVSDPAGQATSIQQDPVLDEPEINTLPVVQLEQAELAGETIQNPMPTPAPPPEPTPATPEPTPEVASTPTPEPTPELPPVTGLSAPEPAPFLEVSEPVIVEATEPIPLADPEVDSDPAIVATSP